MAIPTRIHFFVPEGEADTHADGLDESVITFAEEDLISRWQHSASCLGCSHPRRRQSLQKKQRRAAMVLCNQTTLKVLEELFLGMEDASDSDSSVEEETCAHQESTRQRGLPSLPTRRDTVLFENHDPNDLISSADSLEPSITYLEDFDRTWKSSDLPASLPQRRETLMNFEDAAIDFIEGMLSVSTGTLEEQKEESVREEEELECPGLRRTRSKELPPPLPCRKPSFKIPRKQRVGHEVRPRISASRSA